jgi:error-prone DNA polymerase
LELVNRGSRFAVRDSRGHEEDSSKREARSANRDPDLDLSHLPPDDPAVYRMLQEADTIGIFQVESRAQMATLPRLKPERFYDIVVEVAIILARTLGVPLFQEQLLRMAMVAAGFSGGEAEELRRAFGFKRAEHRMQQIEGKLRKGMAAQGITGEAAEEIIRSITSFALYGFPESHAASFALLVYASAYLKAHYPAAFYTALLNNQPMGFYHPATIVKDAQRHGVRFAPIDVQESDWTCRVDPDGRIRLGLMYVNGLREEVGRRIAAGGWRSVAGGADSNNTLRLDISSADRCPKCGCDDASMLEETAARAMFCNICAHKWDVFPAESSDPRPRESPSAEPPAASRQPPFDGAQRGPEALEGPRMAAGESRTANREPRYESIDDLIARTGVRRDELATLAEIGALNAFGHDRRSALWQIEKAIRPAGELFDHARDDLDARAASHQPPAASRDANSPLRPMTPPERLMADYSGTSLTIGPHPLALRRAELALRGVLRACDLPRGRHGRRVRVAGAVITRQRPGTAKGFVFLTLEDETGIANIIVRPDLFSDQKRAIVGEPYVIVEGTLQIQEGVTSVKAERVIGLTGAGPDPESHDFR